MTTLYRILIDTCIWLDLAKSYRSAPLVHALFEMCNNAELEIIVPDIVLEEFARNKDRISSEATKSLQTHVRLVKQAIPSHAVGDQQRNALVSLDDIDFTAAVGSSPSIVAQVEELMSHPENINIETTTFHRSRAALRGLEKQAPFHRDKNNIADAILFEVYDELRLGKARDHIAFGFASTNFRDFSDPRGDNRLPHPELAYAFSEKSLFITDIAKFVQDVSPDLLNDFDLHHGLAPDFRSLSDLMLEEEKLTDMIWYSRHMARRAAIENGNIKVLAGQDYSRDPYRPGEILDTVWEGALAAAKEVELRYGLENLGPWDDFEWGMLNGKLSAIRWMLGYDWDMLDT